MAVTTATLAGTITDLIGTLDPKYLSRLMLVIESNTTGSLLIDTDGNRHLAGAKRVSIDTTTGIYSATLVKTNSTEILPATGRLYRATLKYPSGFPGEGNQSQTSGWFELTADASLADIWAGLDVIAVTEALYASIAASVAAVEADRVEVAAHRAAVDAVGATTEGLMTSVLGSGGTFDSELTATYGRLSGVQAVASANAALVPMKHNPVDATSGNLTMTLADATSAGQLVVVSKKDSTANTVTISVAHLRDGGAGSIVLVGQYEALTLTSKADGTWWPIGDHKTKAYLDATYGRTPVPNIAFEGDSMSSQGISNTLTVDVYNDIMPAFAIAGIDVRASVYNNATFGKQLATMISGGASTIDNHYSAGKNNICVLWGGTNDLGIGLVSAATVLSRIATFVADRRAAGWKVITLTLLPRSDGAKPAGFDGNRATINAALVANASGVYGDYIANPAANPDIGDDGDSAGVLYFSDGLHMTPYGYATVAKTVRVGLASLGVSLGERGQTFPFAPAFSGAGGSLGVGRRALSTNTATNNTGFGDGALGGSALSGADNTAVGTNALGLNSTGTLNVAVGRNALASCTIGGGNVAIGVFAAQSLVNASNVVAIGYQAAKSNTASENVAIGRDAMTANTTGIQNAAIGTRAMGAGSASDTVAIGHDALSQQSGGARNIGLGTQALRTVTGTDNIGIGHSAGYSPGGVIANRTIAGARQVNIGTESGQWSATQRNDTVALGYRALVDADGAVALGAGSAALHASSVALGNGTATTAAAQVAAGARHLSMLEVAAPGVAAANGARVYAKDNGAGKTQLCVIFQSGTEFVLATEA